MSLTSLSEAQRAAIESRIAAIRGGIHAAVAAAGRPPQSVTLVAVSKKQTAAAVCAAFDAGVTDFGENQLQEMLPKVAAVEATGRKPRWHFVGRLQSNKAAMAAQVSHLIHSVDRPSVADALARAARTTGRSIDVLCQVNVAMEPQKGGVSPEGLTALARHMAASSGLRLKGLMTVPPQGEDPTAVFSRLGTLLQALREEPCGQDATHLSMGMSEDYACAIACGATLVRVGSAIFGER